MKASAAVFAAVCLVGCAHVRHQEPTTLTPASMPTKVIPVAPPPPALTATPAPATAGPARLPAEYEQYYVGMIADYDDPTFTYSPGVLNVRVRPERTRLGGFGDATVAPAFNRGPIGTARMANDHPDATPAEIAAYMHKAQRAIAALTEQNETLFARVQELEKAPATTSPLPTAGSPTIAPVAPSPGVGPAAAASSFPVPQPAVGVPSSEAVQFNMVYPNSDNAIELDPRLFEGAGAASSNPFVQLFQPAVTLRDVDLLVSAAFPGPNPSAVLNDRSLGVGEMFEGLAIHAIEPDRVILRRDTFLLVCPVSEKKLKLRLPQ